MDIGYWLRHFRRNRRNRIEPDWHLTVAERAGRAALLARSLAHFQLGETGGGRHLQRKATRGLDERHREVLALFVEEEREHARLLALLVRRFGGTLIERHWTSALFRLVRRAATFDWEIQVLLSAEVVGAAYYTLIGERAHDPVLRQVCRIVMRDEARHLEFHRDYFCGRCAGRPAWRRRLWSAQFGLAVSAATAAAWLDHRACLRAFGVEWALFAALVRALARHVASGIHVKVSPQAAFDRSPSGD